MDIPARLRAEAGATLRGREWLAGLPQLCAHLSAQWGIRLARPYPGSHISLVAPVHGFSSPAVLKIALPSPIESGTIAGDFRHQEAAALRIWAGDGAPELLAQDAGSGAMLVEQCRPGATLETIGSSAADAAAAEVIQALHHGVHDHDVEFVRLTDRARAVAAQLPDRFAAVGRPFDERLLGEAVDGLVQLAGSTDTEVLLHGDTHHHNILSATRRPWLAIDPLPMLGEPGYDAVQYLLFRKGDLHDPESEWRSVIESFCGRLDVDPDRVMAWIFVRLVSDAIAACERGRPIVDLEARNGDLWTARLVQRLRR
ncbi:aminoglycoside phosphotransferase family protein [Microlunatus soli]|uniref:Streptomycin 6-kinase n=1 Tax=Microlunatus soli TaxID=630515 RepID=A0A1H1Z7C2_9ACTN|nr:aminoglycoside phosphotransferase family protein [Microlunatus soli]SDT29467.1 streptomycin 6-kinase [Microlunatus soli]